MKKKLLAVVIAASMVLSVAACGSKETTEAVSESDSIIQEIPINEDPIVISTEEEPEEEPEEVIPENSYRSELTNEWISNDIKDQRPIAVMVDNDEVALPHYGTSDADIVYEIMNSTLNARVTRLMCIIKDWDNIDQIGNVRSTRPTNCMLFAEYNAVLIHDGGPFMINDWLAYPNATNHLSGGFARIDRGKADFYEEYATGSHYKGEGQYAGKSYSSIRERIEDAGYSTEYNQYKMDDHFKFSDTEISLEDAADSFKAEKIELPYEHNHSTLTYDEESGKYIYSECGKKYEDALYDDGRGLAFENVILQCSDFFEYGDGYMCFNAIDHDKKGIFCTNGYAIPITWTKLNQDDLTHFKIAGTDEEITLNTGKTYITICPSDVWDDLTIY